MTKAVQQYLNRYSETESADALELFKTAPSVYKLGVTIPAFDESIDHVERFSEWCKQNQVPTLLVLVVNTPEHCSSEAKNNTHKLIQTIEHRFTIRASHKHIELLHCHPKLDILLINRTSSQPIPNQLGVGLARKIGADTVASLIQNKIIELPWICSTDADATLPDNYYQALKMASPKSAAVFPFKHEREETPVGMATIIYEMALLYYVLGIRYTGFPYDWPTIGSTLTIHYECYCQIRGFPKRSGGEDFYLLNKASKISPIQYIKSSPIIIQSRISDRVPFGTGPAVGKLISGEEQTLTTLWQSFSYYDPRLFSLLAILNQGIQQCGLELKPVSLIDLPNQNQNITATLLKELETRGQFIERSKRIIQQYKTTDKVLRQLYQEFDAFQLLKMIHWLRDGSFPNISLKNALTTAPFIPPVTNSICNDWQQTVAFADQLHHEVFVSRLSNGG